MARSRQQRGSELRGPSLRFFVVVNCLASSLGWKLQRPPSSRDAPLSRDAASSPFIFQLLHRRAMLKSVPVLAATVWTNQPAHSLSGNCGYPVCKTQDEWQQSLSKQQFFILRREGTESPRSSPLLREQRDGKFQCAACGVQMFSSDDQIDSKTGWLTFAAASNVEIEQSWLESIVGTKVKCARCGGHIGERFKDASQYPGTKVARTGNRYSINGAGLVFFPADGSAARSGEAPVSDAVEYWEQRPWRMADGGLRPV